MKTPLRLAARVLFPLGGKFRTHTGSTIVAIFVVTLSLTACNRDSTANGVQNQPLQVEAQEKTRASMKVQEIPVQAPIIAAILLDDIDEQADAATDFSTAFALDRTCAGLVMVRGRTAKINPSARDFLDKNERYWLLHTGYSTDNQSSVLNWDMSQAPDAAGYVTKSDESPEKAAAHVCAIVKHNGGQVR